MTQFGPTRPDISTLPELTQPITQRLEKKELLKPLQESVLEKLGYLDMHMENTKEPRDRLAQKYKGTPDEKRFANFIDEVQKSVKTGTIGAYKYWAEALDKEDVMLADIVVSPYSKKSYLLSQAHDKWNDLRVKKPMDDFKKKQDGLENFLFNLITARVDYYDLIGGDLKMADGLFHLLADDKAITNGKVTFKVGNKDLVIDQQLAMQTLRTGLAIRAEDETYKELRDRIKPHQTEEEETNKFFLDFSENLPENIYKSFSDAVSTQDSKLEALASDTRPHELDPLTPTWDKIRKGRQALVQAYSDKKEASEALAYISISGRYRMSDAILDAQTEVGSLLTEQLKKGEKEINTAQAKHDLGIKASNEVYIELHSFEQPDNGLFDTIKAIEQSSDITSRLLGEDPKLAKDVFEFASGRKQVRDKKGGLVPPEKLTQIITKALKFNYAKSICDQMEKDKHYFLRTDPFS
ncbi:MAG: hypothetical protein M1366_06650 [Patescibacteria group bacterium]|nr:hypothetical protein [Patescibacteria group bacterium]